MKKEGIMNGTRLIKVHPGLVKEADEFRREFFEMTKINIPRTTVTQMMAETFGKMRRVNGMPSTIIKDKRIGRRKEKHLFCNWEFKI